jgi:hypothetical protein
MAAPSPIARLTDIIEAVELIRSEIDAPEFGNRQTQPLTAVAIFRVASVQIGLANKPFK